MEITKIIYSIGYKVQEELIEVNDKVFFKNFTISDMNAKNKQI